MTMSGQPWEIAIVQTFFSPNASNHPGAIFDLENFGVQLPNWFYYYSLLYTAPGDYANQPVSEASENGTIIIGNDADQPGNKAIYRLAKGAEYISWAGVLNVRGIHAYIWACEHEAGHEYYFNAGIDKPGRPQYVLGGAVYPEEDPNGDWDEDGKIGQKEVFNGGLGFQIAWKKTRQQLHHLYPGPSTQPYPILTLRK